MENDHPLRDTFFFGNNDFENSFRDCSFENDGNSLRDHIVANDVTEIICLKNDGFFRESRVYICAQTSFSTVSIMSMLFGCICYGFPVGSIVCYYAIVVNFKWLPDDVSLSLCLSYAYLFLQLHTVFLISMLAASVSNM